MRPFNKIAIIGTGLIGGSLGLVVKKKGLAGEIVGVCRHQESIRKAIQKKAIDKGTLDYKEAVEDADLVILAVPVKEIIRIAGIILPYLKPGCLVSDVGSTKSEIIRRIEGRYARKGFSFVGAHPLAGSEKRGVAEARADLFTGTLCILTRSKKTNPAALKEMAAFWKKAGCRIQVLSPGRHDRVTALISHLPHLAAMELVKAAAGSLDFAASGFFDTTRIASSDAEIWTDIFLSNKKPVIRAINEYIKQLARARDLIRREDRKKLNAEFRRIKTLRDACKK
jgi:prephenate dehydrogenase